jgi:CHAT domain-containing protein
MKKLGLIVSLLLLLSHSIFSQDKKIDKSLKKIDDNIAAGNLMKASDGLKKLKPSVVSKLGASNTYMPGIYLREARLNLALGILIGFDQTLSTALTEAAKTYGENSDTYAMTFLEVAAIYNEYGNFRIAREYTKKSSESLNKTKEIDQSLKARIALIEAEAMIGQGFCNDAIALLNQYQDYFFKRAVEKETYVENGEIKSRRVPETEIFQRFNDYVNHQTLLGYAYGQKGRISIVGSNEENPDIDRVYNQLESWLKGKHRFLGETSLAEVKYKYYWTNALVKNGLVGSKQGKELTFSENIDDLKKVTNPSNALAHEIYLSYLAELLSKESFSKYLTIKGDYEKVIDKYYPKTSLHRINLKAVEFNSKLAKDKTANIEDEAIAILNSKSLPPNYKTTNLILKFLYDMAISQKKYGDAEKYLNQIAEAKKELCGEKSPEYHLAKIELANFYLDYTNKIADAGKIYQESFFGIVEPQIGEQQAALLRTLNHIAQWYELTDQYADASKTLKKLEDAIRIKYDNRDILYAKELGSVAKLQLKLGEYDNAETNIVQALKIVEDKDNRIYPEWRTVYISVLDAQAKLFAIKGMFDEAENNLRKSKDLVKDSKVALTSEESGTSELAPLLIMLGDYSSADKLLVEQIPQYEKLYGSSSIRVIDPLINKSRIALAKGDYADSERLALRANKIAIHTYGENSTKSAPTQRLLSDIYYSLGDYDKAEEQIRRAMKSQEKQFGRKHVEVAKSISQLALIKFYKGDDKKEIEKLMLESKAIMEAKLGKDNPQYAEILKNVAVLYISEKRFDIAFNSLTVAESIWSAKSGKENNINLASIYTLTGEVYYHIKNFQKAEDFYTRGKELYEKFFSTSHPEYVKILSRMSKVYYMKKDYKRSKKLIEEALGNYENFIQQLFPALSEAQKAKYWNTMKVDFEFYNTLAFSNLEDFRDLSGKVYNYQLLTKALLLSSSIKMRERIMNSTDEDLKAQYNQWIQKKEVLTLALSMTPAQLTENGIDPGALQQDVERLEKELSRRSELFGQSIESKKITFEDVKKSLKQNEVAIEMVRYRFFNHVLTDSIIYAAIYIRSDMSKPKVIMMENGKKMETRFFKYYRNCITGKLEDQYSYGVFWKPIQEVMGTAATIYLSPDGVYNQINLEAIPTPDGRFIIDNSNIVLVSNTKDLYLNKVRSRATNSENSASIFANPIFYANSSTEQRIPSLPGTEKEGNQVQFMLKQKGWQTAQYLELNATEENIKGLNSPRILHFATHGFYQNREQIGDADEMQESMAVLTNNPLLRTGLLLKGAGDLMDKTKFNYNIESGILTAAEAMNLSLDKTDLVVLSACETGLGELEAGEGVHGLQRSFLVAGAKVLIMSMFKVDDDATQNLMLKFYQKWLNSGKIRASFIEAKKELRTEYPEPIYWGAFMVIGLE